MFVQIVFKPRKNIKLWQRSKFKLYNKIKTYG